MTVACHVFEHHTGEVQLRLEAATREELYAEAGRALAELMTERVIGEPAEPEPVEIHGRDAATLLVAWVNELIDRSESEGRAYDDLVVEHVSDTSLRAVIRGRRLDAIRTAVKAATSHDVRIDGADGAWTARLVLDV